jgi:hypothetical protein
MHAPKPRLFRFTQEPLTPAVRSARAANLTVWLLLLVVGGIVAMALISTGPVAPQFPKPEEQPVELEAMAR